MKCRFRVKREEGIALVITLVMLAVVTVMAIVFLAITRRERSSVKLAEETAVAKDMADAGLERAKTEAIAVMNSAGSKLYYDLFNSQAFYHPNGFDPAKGLTNVNVGPVRDWPAIRQKNQKDYLTLLGNLQYDSPAPVFVQTNDNGQGDFRFYLDFNRNGQFETNGFLYDLDVNERPITRSVGGKIVTNIYKFVGDPEWIGVLERPDLPHSETNRFIGRLAYLVLPAGKTLDLNFMHNQVNGPTRLDVNNASGPGFSRSQGVGSWEINLAAFLRELNTNTYAWGFPNSYRYAILPNQPPNTSGAAFDDARNILKFRYTRTNYLDSIYKAVAQDNMLNPMVPAVFNTFQKFNNNNVEDFGGRPYLALNGEVFFPPNQAPLDRDDPAVPGWPGSFNTNAFTDLQQLFSAGLITQPFEARLQNAARRNASAVTGKSSYDRYTFYRLAAELGTDSNPALEGKIHLNYKNPIGQITNSVVPWTNAVEFFTNAADLMLKASIDETVTLTGANLAEMRLYGRPPGTYYRIGDTLVRTNFSITNIQVEARNPVPGALPFITQNEYTPTIHRLLQVAANIYDNMNDDRSLPHVFVPEFFKTPTNIIITGFHPLTNVNELTSKQWVEMTTALTNSIVPLGAVQRHHLYGEHFVIGAKKGHPNFNELSMQMNVHLSRKLSATKSSQASTNITSTNQMFIVNMDNRWGMEAWNSYTGTNKSQFRLFGEVNSHIVMRDGTNIYNPIIFETNITVSVQPPPALNVTDWVGVKRFENATNFVVLFDAISPILNERSYSTNRIPPFGPTNSLAQFGPLERTPEFAIFTTNSVRFWIVDNGRDNHLIDFVSYDKLTTMMDLKKDLYPTINRQSGSSLVNPTAAVNENMFWDPTPIGGVNSGFTVGHSNQLAVSSGDIPEADTDAFWRPYTYSSPDKRGGVAVWRKFLGLPLRAQDNPRTQAPAVLTHQAPFTPTKSISRVVSWQVDDPLVHYMHEDLAQVLHSEAVPVNMVNTNWNIGRLNDAYRPWGGFPGKTAGDIFAYNVGVKDPGIRKSDDWEFPVARRSTLNNNTNYFFPNIGTLGQVHRGTPWQTLYLKSIYRRSPDPTKIDPVDGGGQREVFVSPSQWLTLRGSLGSFPSRDWRLLDVFTTAPNENAARGLLSVNQTNSAAWSAVLGGVVVAKTAVSGSGSRVVPPEEGFDPAVIEPGTPQMEAIIQSILDARTNQYQFVPNPNRNPTDPNGPYLTVLRTNLFSQPYSTFDHMGDILGTPALSVQNPYLRGMLGPGQAGLVNNVWNDRAVEFIPQQILSLLQRDDPRFVVYAFGQSLKPAPRSLTSDPDYFHMCTNYQIMGEVITKTTFRVEGDPVDRRTGRLPANPLRAVVEKYEILPPAE